MFSSLLSRVSSPRREGKMVVPELSEGARARQEVLRSLLRTPACPGDEEYEALLANAYEIATSLAGMASTHHHRTVESREGWEAIGFQAVKPDNEFRGGGLLGLHCLIYVLTNRGELCRTLINGPFPFAAASINMTLVAADLAGVVGEDRLSEYRAQHLLSSSHEGFFELHVAALEALERARRDVEAGPMEFAGCATAARDEVAVLLSHEPRDVDGLKSLVEAVPRRTAGFLIALVFPSTEKQRRRRKCWFTLSTGELRWYDEKDVHCHDARAAAVALDPANPAGRFKLGEGMTVKFNQRAHSFSVYDEYDKVEFHAVAQDASSMERWCVALTEHVALAASSSSGGKAASVKRTLASETFGEDGITFKVVETIGIYVRSNPDVAATRTGKALMPGESVTVVERRTIDDPAAGPQGRSFLKILPGDSSWVMEHHPTTREPILLPASIE